MEVCRFGAVGEVPTVGLEKTGKAGPGGGGKTSRLIVSSVIAPLHLGLSLAFLVVGGLVS